MAQIFAPKIWGSVAGPTAEWCRKLAEAIEQLANGSGRSVGTLTLTAGTTTTTVQSIYVTPTSHITLTPTTANGAAAIATTYVSARNNGVSFVLTHANSAQTDRSFTYEVRNP